MRAVVIGRPYYLVAIAGKRVIHYSSLIASIYVYYQASVN